MNSSDQREAALRIDITPRTVLLFLTALFGVWLLVQLWHVLLVLVVALIIVGTLNPLVCAFERRGVSRTPALVLIALAMVVAVTALGLLVVPPLVSQLTEIANHLPEQREWLIKWLQRRNFTAPLAQLTKDARSQEFLLRMTRHALTYSSVVAIAVGYGFTALFLAFYLLADATRARGALFSLVPRRFHLRLARVLTNLETIVGGYMRGQLITSLAIGVFTFAFLGAMGVPNAVALAVFAAITDVIPFVGAFFATIPATLSALPLGTGTALIVITVLVVYQEFESRILVPRVYGRVLRLSPAVVLIALMIGASLLGIVGAFLALPVAAGIEMIAKEMRVAMPGDDSDDRNLRGRDQRAERAYEHLSSGAPPTQAAAIATQIAQDIRKADASDPAVAAKLPITGGHEK